MTRANKLIKISSLIYLIGAFSIIPYQTILGGIFLTIGIILLSYSFLSIEVLQEKKPLLIALSILAIFLGAMPAVFLFMAVDEISSFKQNSINSPPEDAISSETKRIDLLLKIGLAMVIISGILFATSTWETITDIFKLIIMILMGIAFLLLSTFSEKTLKIEKTTKAYYILGLTFFMLTWIGICVFGSISPWLTYTGAGKKLAYFITFVILAIILYFINKKFNEQEYKYFSYISCYLAFYHFLTFLNLSLIEITLIVTLISLLINIFVKNDKTLQDLTENLSYLYFPIIISSSLESPSFLVSVTSLITIINVLYLSTKTKDQFYNISSILISYLLISVSIFNLDISNTNIIIFILNSLLYLLINHNKLNRENHILKTNQNIYNISSSVLILSMTTYNLKFIIFAFLFLIINLINCYITNKESSDNDLYYQPVIIFICGLSIYNCLQSIIEQLNPIYIFILVTTVYTLIDYFINDEKISNVYFKATTILSIITLLLNMGELNIVVSIILILLFIYNYLEKKTTNNYFYYYILILLSVYNFTKCIIDIGISTLLSNILLLTVFGLLTYFIKDKKLRTINLISLVVPLSGIVSSTNLNTELQTIVDNIFAFYILFLIVTLIAKTDESKDVVATIGTSVLSLTILGEGEILTGLYICILGVGILVYTYNKQKYKKLFYTGAVLTILNIIIQLKDFWTSLPPWLYLLLIGISIIVFVTYKEKRKLDNKDKPKPKKEQPKLIVETPPEYSEKTEVLEDLPLELEKAEFCPFCGTKNLGGNFCLNCGQKLLIPTKKNK